jgi:gas vesicle protein
MNFDSKTLLICSIVLIIGAVIGASAASVFADDPFKGKSSLEQKEENKNDCNDSRATGADGSCSIERSHDVDQVKIYSKNTTSEPSQNN